MFSLTQKCNRFIPGIQSSTDNIGAFSYKQTFTRFRLSTQLSFCKCAKISTPGCSKEDISITGIYFYIFKFTIFLFLVYALRYSSFFRYSNFYYSIFLIFKRRYASSIRSNGKRCVIRGVVSIFPSSIKCRIVTQSQPSTPPVLKIRFLPYISGKGKI